MLKTEFSLSELTVVASRYSVKKIPKGCASLLRAQMSRVSVSALAAPLVFSRSAARSRCAPWGWLSDARPALGGGERRAPRVRCGASRSRASRKGHGDSECSGTRVDHVNKTNSHRSGATMRQTLGNLDRPEK